MFLVGFIDSCACKPSCELFEGFLSLISVLLQDLMEKWYQRLASWILFPGYRSRISLTICVSNDIDSFDG